MESMRARRTAVSVILMVGVQSCRCGRQPPSPTPVPRVVADAPDAGGSGAALLLEPRGQVELQRGGGAWEPAARGARIGVSDGLRTPGDGEAELSVDGVRVKLHDRSELRLTAASAGLLRARVRGRVESDVDEGRGQVSLQVEDGDAVAESSGGHFVLTAEGKTAVVAATRGTVRLGAAGRNVDLRKDQMASVHEGELGQPIAALRKVLLAVEWPGDKTNHGTVPVAGHVSPGSRVYVQGQLVEVDPSGEFHTDVRLDEGRQQIAVVTIDAFGRRNTARTEVTRDQSRPRVQVDAPWTR